MITAVDFRRAGHELLDIFMRKLAKWVWVVAILAIVFLVARESGAL